MMCIRGFTGVYRTSYSNCFLSELVVTISRFHNNFSPDLFAKILVKVILQRFTAPWLSPEKQTHFTSAVLTLNICLSLRWVLPLWGKSDPALPSDNNLHPVSQALPSHNSLWNIFLPLHCMSWFPHHTPAPLRSSSLLVPHVPELHHCSASSE